MVESNWIFRNELSSLVQKYENIHSVIMSAATVKTDTEDQFRKYSLDKEYWVSAENVAHELVKYISNHKNSLIDEDVFVHHPRYEEYYKNETDEKLNKRQLFDITNIRL